MATTSADPVLMLLRGDGGGGIGPPSCRKERSVSDPGPHPGLLTLNTALASTIAAGEDPTMAVFSTVPQQRALVSPTGVLSDFQKLGTHEGENLPAYHHQSSSGGRLPFNAGGFSEHRLLGSAYATLDAAAVRGSVIAQAGGGQLSAGMQPADAALLSVPLCDTSITTPLGGSDNDDDEKSMSAIGAAGPSATTLPRSPSEGLFDTFDLKGGPTTTAGDPLMLLNRVAEPPASSRLLPRSLIASGGRGGGSMIKQEVCENMDLFPSPEDSNSTTEEATMRELLDEKDRMDIASFINEYNDEIYAQNCNQRRSNVNSMETEDEMTKIFIRVKEEPTASAAMATAVASQAAASPDTGTVFSMGSSAATLDEAVDEEAKDVLVPFDSDLDQPPPAISSQPPEQVAAAAAVNLSPTTSYICTATVLAAQSPLATGLSEGAAAVAPRPIFIRKQSQDSLTRTKNPVLPNIHAELLPLVVPEPRQARYQNQPTAEPPFSLDDFDEEEAGGVTSAAVVAVRASSPTPPQQQQQQPQLTELKGSLFLPEDYNQSYFQPWN
jgi:hypothetical protein